jgi:GNAT superfamily N-acetyltransferase
MDAMPDTLQYARDAPSTRLILESLPEWFGDPQAITNYELAADSADFTSLVSVMDGRTVGVTLIRRHFPESAEIHLIAVAPDVRGQGIGRLMIEQFAADLASDGCALLSVHTVGASFDSDAYATTRAFYEATGFFPLEEHDGLDWTGPSLILVRPLHRVH